MKAKINSLLILFTIGFSSLLLAAIPVKREQVNNTISNVELIALDFDSQDIQLDQSGPDIDWTAFLLCWFFGVFGAHRFYMGKTGSAILQLLTLGGLGIWALIDLIRIITGSLS